MAMSVEKLVEHFSTLEDPWCAGKVDHRLIDILVIAVCAVIACAESWDDIQGRRMKSASQKSEHVIIVPGGLLATRPHADPGCSVPPHEVDGDLAQDGQVARCRAIPDAAVILAEGDIEDPMEPIFNRPVPADRLDQHRGVITAA